MKIERKLITPAYAKQLLEANTRNRKVKPSVLQRYTNDISEGRWKKDTGELIKISKSGVVLDGQHRLMAVVNAKKPTSFHIAYNLSDEIFDVLDTGSVRSAIDVFNINHVKYGNIIPSIIQVSELLKDGKRKNFNAKKDYSKTNAELLSIYSEDQDFYETVGSQTIKWYLNFSKVLSPKIIGGMYVYLFSVSPSDAEDFMNQLCTGSDITNKSVLALRNKLIEDKLSTKKMPQSIKTSLIVKTWNLFREGREVKLLKYDEREGIITAI